jgi:hypothetical protein
MSNRVSAVSWLTCAYYAVNRIQTDSHLSPDAQDMNEFRRLGEAITGHALSDEEVRGQLSRADADGNDRLDLDEWLAFGQVLGAMPDVKFVAMVDSFIQRLTESAHK